MSRVAKKPVVASRKRGGERKEAEAFGGAGDEMNEFAIPVSPNTTVCAVARALVAKGCVHCIGGLASRCCIHALCCAGNNDSGAGRPTATDS